MSNAMDNLYDVTNGVNTVNAADHNTLVDASQFQYDGFGGVFNFGNGRDGHMYLGAISATTSTACTNALNGSGNLTGTFYYKYSAYNLSGETAASTASSTIVTSGQQVAVTIPGTGNNTNITGFYVYRSADNVTYYRVGFVTVDTPTSGAVFYDNFPIASGTAPSGSNTTTTTATTEGIFLARTFTMVTGQTLTVTTGSSIGLVIICQGNVVFNSGATINASGKGSTTTSPVTGTANSVATGTLPSGRWGGVGLFPSASYCYVDLLRHYNKQGTGGGTTPGAPGGSVMIISQTQIIAQGTITATAAASTGNASESVGGSAGGNIILIAPYINRNGGTFTANGANAATYSSGSDGGSGGGGGGLVAFVADYLVGTATSTVNGGTGSATGTGTGAGGGAGAGNAGDGAINGAGNAGSTGLVHTATLRNTLMRF